MAMSVGAEGGDDAPMSEINTTPLVDIMLVMLIIFLITIPVVLESVDLKLPSVAFEPTTTKPENVLLSIRTPDANNDGQPDGSGACEVYWGDAPITAKELRDKGSEKLKQLIEDVGGVDKITEETMPEVHIRGDVNTPYSCIGGAIINVQAVGFQKVAFVSEPTPGSIEVVR
jgi:biopolymer transport protein ExbD